MRQCARRQGESAKIRSVAPLVGEAIDSRKMARRHTCCIVKRTELENMCPFRVGLLHKNDQIPKQNGAARHKPQNLLKIFSQDEANRHN